MGRPINKKHFGNTNDDGLGGEGLASVTVTGAGTGYTTGEAVTISAPQLPGGTQAVATVVDDGSGGVDSVTVTTAGTGYTSAPTITFGTGGADATGTGVLTDSRTNAISLTAFVTGGSNLTGDVVTQKGAKRFKVTTATGTEVCKLVTATPAAGGEMRITAVDSNGDTYFLSKISARTCTVVRGTGTEFAEGAKVKWTKGSAVLNDSVSINNA
jgi:hypothetical protein